MYPQAKMINNSMMTDCSQPFSSVADVYAKNYTLCRTLQQKTALKKSSFSEGFSFP